MKKLRNLKHIHIFAVMLVALSVFSLGSAEAARPAVELDLQVQSGALVNVNTASAEDLQAIKGIGAKTAERIIEYREAYGPFEDANDLSLVKGIGGKKLQSIKDQVTV